MSSYGSKGKQELSPVNQFQMLPGRGVKARIDGKEVLAGNEELLAEENIPAAADPSLVGRYLGQGCTVIYLAIDHTLAGFLALSDTLREDAKAMIRAVKEAGVTPVLLTGDHENAARAIAQQLEIDEVHAGCLPEDKLHWIDTYQKERHYVCMIGDGINDAPALKKAYVGIAMGGVGSDIAVDAADIALVNDDIKERPTFCAWQSA